MQRVHFFCIHILILCILLKSAYFSVAKLVCKTSGLLVNYHPCPTAPAWYEVSAGSECITGFIHKAAGITLSPWFLSEWLFRPNSSPLTRFLSIPALFTIPPSKSSRSVVGGWWREDIAICLFFLTSLRARDTKIWGGEGEANTHWKPPPSPSFPPQRFI